jgi:hypothetical protein
LEIKKRRNIWEGIMIMKKINGKTNLIHRGRRRGGGHCKGSTVQRAKEIWAFYKDRLKRSVKTINMEHWKLASKGQSQFRKIQIKN